ncbi:hypothetical protein MMC32_003567 [Xylographa parallela]|nr:hypothetical protein [Xylographa parallela]
MSTESDLSRLQSYNSETLTYPNLQRVPESRSGLSVQAESSQMPFSTAEDPPGSKPSLLSLPLEIRHYIYELLFGSLTITLLPNKFMMRHTPRYYKFRPNQAHNALTHRLASATDYTPTVPGAAPFDFSGLNKTQAAKALRFVHSTFDTSTSSSLLLSLALLTTSHQLYAETTLVLYTSATFRVQSQHLFNFLHHRTPAQLTLLRRLAVVEVLLSKLQTRTFRRVMDAAAGSCKGLRELEVGLRLGRELWSVTKRKGGRVGWVEGVRAWRGGRLWVVRVRLEGAKGEGVGEKDGGEMERMGRVLEGELVGVGGGDGERGGEGEGQG